MIVLHTVNELTNFLNHTDLSTLVGAVRFDGELFQYVVEKGYKNQLSIDGDIGFLDDGGWIEIDDNGIVIDDRYLP